MDAIWDYNELSGDPSPRGQSYFSGSGRSFHYRSAMTNVFRSDRSSTDSGTCTLWMLCMVTSKLLVIRISEAFSKYQSCRSQANILVNSYHAPCLADFGLAKPLYSTGTIDTATGSTRGAIRWMSPELLGLNDHDREAGRPNRASDIYALATVFWEARG